jgi:diketogulonate reductase-like aldo/keto reductase
MQCPLVTPSKLIAGSCMVARGQNGAELLYSEVILTVARQPLSRWSGQSVAVIIAIPESGSAAHVKENVVALSMTLTPEDLQTLDAAHPRPRH